MKKDKKFIVVLLSIFFVLLSTTLFVTFSGNFEEDVVVLKSITPVYDSNSTVVVDSNNVVFNDKNQVVDYKIVIENTQNYDVKITDILLSTPTEEFLQYTLKDISKDDVLAANSTKELIISLETMGIEGWGRNFADELTANISFEKVVKEVTPPTKNDKEEEQRPEAPATNIEEIITKTEKIEVTSITKNTIEFKENIKVKTGDKIAVWIYSEPIFLGYFDVVETNGVKQIVGLEEALKKANIQAGGHNIVLATEEGEALGYVEVYVGENNTLSQEKPLDETNKEDGSTGIEPPNTSDKGLLVVLVIATGVTGLGIILVSKNKFTKYTVLVILLSSTLTITNAEEVIELPVKFNVKFESQNVMKPSGLEYDYDSDIFLSEGEDYWSYAPQIKNFYIQNEIVEISEYAYEFDVTEDNNGRVIAYLVEREDDSTCYDSYYNEDLICYDLYLQADGIIYPNKDASYYFFFMENLDSIDNITGFDTSNVTNMSNMFGFVGFNSSDFILDVSNFDTSKVTNMSYMFFGTGSTSETFTLDVSNFDTGNVTDMSYMFFDTGYNSTEFTLDVSNFDTSNVTNMNSMFAYTGYSNPNFNLNLSNFDTSKVTDMSCMFTYTGYNSTEFTLDVSNFDTSNVTNMNSMFAYTGYSNPNFNLNLSNFDTSKVTDMSCMFTYTGYNSTNFTLDLSGWDTGNVTDMSYMFSRTGYNSTKLNTSITISNPNTTSYSNMFYNVATKEGSQITVNYLSESEDLVAKMIATKSEESNVVKGNCIDCGEGYIPIGTEVDINGEKFNVINQAEDTVTMLAQYNISPDYKQSKTENNVPFSNSTGWEYTPGPKEIDTQKWSTNPKTYVNAYVEYLKAELGDDSVTGDLITLKELKSLGCNFRDDYSSTNNATCINSPYKSWLINGQFWWTRSADSRFSYYIWIMYDDGSLYGSSYFSGNDVRPVITISKETLRNLG